VGGDLGFGLGWEGIWVLGWGWREGYWGGMGGILVQVSKAVKG
jgi:hypothetical protein